MTEADVAIDRSLRLTAPGERPRVLALANQKGGVGKTTTAINLGTALAAIGENVLILDLDPQGNASTGLGIDRRSRRVSTYHVVAGEAHLSEAVIASSRDRAHRLRKAIERLVRDQGEDAFTYILIDCPPSLNLLTINALAAA